MKSKSNMQAKFSILHLPSLWDGFTRSNVAFVHLSIFKLKLKHLDTKAKGVLHISQAFRTPHPVPWIQTSDVQHGAT